MQVKEIERFKIALLEKNGSVIIHLLDSSGSPHAIASVDKKSKRLNFADASGNSSPANHVLLEEEAVDLGKYFSRGLCAGSLPDMIILDAAYQFVLKNDAAKYDEPSVDTDEFDIVLRARSDIPLGTSGSASSSSTSGSAQRKPKRRKTAIAVWI